MDTETQGVKFSEFPAAETPINADEVVGLHNGGNARFSLANLILLIRSALTSVFVPQSRTINGQALSSDVALDASDVGAVDEAAVGAANGVASLGSDGKVPSAQLPEIPSNVEANPSGAATDTLTKLQVDQTIYAVSGGSGVDYLTVVNGKICVIYEVTP